MLMCIFAEFYFRECSQVKAVAAARAGPGAGGPARPPHDALSEKATHRSKLFHSRWVSGVLIGTLQLEFGIEYREVPMFPERPGRGG